MEKKRKRAGRNKKKAGKTWGRTKKKRGGRTGSNKKEKIAWISNEIGGYVFLYHGQKSWSWYEQT